MEDQSVSSAGTPKKSKRTGLIIGGVIALLVLLASAAFVGGRLLNQAAPASAGQSNMVMSGGPGGAQFIAVQIVPAKELPSTAPDVRGLFSARKDNSIYVLIGNKFMVQVDKNGTVNTQTDSNGDRLEVVVTNDTTIYKEVTQPGLNGAPPIDGKMQQQVAPGSLDEIGSNSIVSAWGERNGDRLIARVLLYSQPVMINRP